MRRTLELQDALRLVVGGPVVLVTTRWRDETNVMPAIWVTPVSRTPPLVAVAIQSSRHTHDLVRFAEEFALNFPGRELMNHVQYFGLVSGREVNKLELAKLHTFKAQRIAAPLIEGCLAYVECGLEDALRLGDHTLFVGRVVTVQAERDAFDETWTLTDTDYKPLHYLGIDRYAVLEEPLQAKLRTSDEGDIELQEAAEEREQREEEEEKAREREGQDKG